MALIMLESISIKRFVLSLMMCACLNLGLVSSVPTQSRGNIWVSTLHEAVMIGNVEMVKSLIKDGADVNSYSSNGLTPLHLAAMYHRSDILAVLLQNGANANAFTPNGWTILHLMSEVGDASAVKIILEHAQGLGVDLPNADGLTATHLAAKSNDLDVMDALLQKGANINSRTTDGSTILHLVAAQGNIDFVNYILKSDQAMLAAVNNDLKTPLGLARVNRHYDAAKTITTAMGDVSTYNFYRANTVPEVKTLLLKGATDGPGWAGGAFSLLHKAAQIDLLDVLKFLVDNGEPIDIGNELGDNQTPLYEAAHYGNLDEVKYLVENGADILKKGLGGLTPLEAAEQQGHPDVVAYLKAHGG